jgi:hypothetical protein
MLTEQQAAVVGFYFPADPIKDLPIRQEPIGFASSTATHQMRQPQDPAASKRHCSVQRCKRVAVDECGLCKSCCGNCGLGCANRKHNTAPPHRVHATTFTLTCPSAVMPLLNMVSAMHGLPTAASGSSVSPNQEMGLHFFRDEMSDEWAREWNEREREVTERREAAEMKRRMSWPLPGRLSYSFGVRYVLVHSLFVIHLQN